MRAVWGKIKNQAKFISKRFFLYALKNGKERRIKPFLSARAKEIVRWMWFWPDAMQGARSAAVRALQGTGNAAARRPRPQTCTIYFVRVLTYISHCAADDRLHFYFFGAIVFHSFARMYSCQKYEQP
jgi:hypothetical protein